VGRLVQPRPGTRLRPCSWRKGEGEGGGAGRRAHAAWRVRQARSPSAAPHTPQVRGARGCRLPAGRPGGGRVAAGPGRQPGVVQSHAGGGGCWPLEGRWLPRAPLCVASLCGGGMPGRRGGTQARACSGWRAATGHRSAAAAPPALPIRCRACCARLAAAASEAGSASSAAAAAADRKPLQRCQHQHRGRCWRCRCCRC
jgi:hypothetical protein